MQRIFTTLLFLLVILSSPAAAQVVVTDDISSDMTWTSDNEYVLDGLIFVNDGATLTIEPGTVIKGRLQSNITTGDGASALIVRRGAQIMAEGTAQQPIVFTSELDDVNDPEDLTQRDRGLWGGMILLGRATTNQPTQDNQIEGIPESEDARYGGTDDGDDSGVLRYVSIRHGGFSISGVSGDEINGLTMGAVGSGTTIEYVEVFANLDDGFEWFGGTVNGKYLVSAFVGDDGFDYDQGFRGQGQFWFSIHDEDEAGRSGEHDGGDDDETGTPFSIPVISNVTYVGVGVSTVGTGGDANDRAIVFRDNAGGKYYNSVFVDFPGVGINVEDLASGEDSRSRLEAGDLELRNNIFFDFGAGSTLEAIIPQEFVRTSSSFVGNEVVDPQLAGISRIPSFGLDPRPLVGSPILSGWEQPPNGDFFTEVDYLGAFGAELWVKGWTALDADGFLGNISTVAIDVLDGEVPSRIVLEQNYPNPFNPSTTIAFQLDRSQDVRLAVYDLMGREVAVLVDGRQPAGSYRATFDASNLASGLYLYRLHTDSGTFTKKMMLLK